ncbi:MAG: 6-bladed beta-propeller, partial [Bacteroides sp.]|nr:6-bladed beta-propeller [Bacteroides sp.]
MLNVGNKYITLKFRWCIRLSRYNKNDHEKRNYLLFILLLIGCQKETANDVTIQSITIDPDKTLPKLDLSVHIDQIIDIIALETSDECLLSQIKKIVVHKDRIYVSDQVNPGVFIFDRNGKFIAKIGSQGSGPDEFLYMGKFYIFDNHLYIQDIWG